QIEAEDFNSQLGIQAETCSEGGENIGYIENEDYAVYKNINFESGAAEFLVRCSSATDGGSMEIRLDSITGPLLGTCEVGGTGDWQTYTNVTCSVTAASGTHDLYLIFTGGSDYLFNVNWFKFTKATSSGTLGDLNGDGKVNSTDYSLLRRHILGINQLEGTALTNADVNKSGSVDSTDYALMRRYILGIITLF
ncbi:MAG: carbohydrate-binding protein, partial [Clostridiaceae bacterium]|nr:carbohydrate-binding protein [Clostridiaceae bacterium]